MTILIPVGLSVIGNIIGSVLVAVTGVYALAYIGQLIGLVGSIFALLQFYQMLNEIKSVTKNESFSWWFILIPIYGIIWLLTTARQEIAKAKQMVGAQQPVRSGIAYFFFSLYVMAADVNDLAARMPPG